MNRFSHFGVVAAVLAVSLLASACDFSGVSDSIDDFQLIIGLEPIHSVVAGQLLDARTGELVEKEVQLSFTGEDADVIIDLYSDPISEQSVEGGLTSFGIENSATPSSSSPLTFTVSAEAAGYLESSEKVTLREGGDQEFLLYLTSENQPPEGASATRQESGEAGSDGAVTSSFSVETPAETVSGGSASLSVEEGTVARDASGANLSGTLSTQITYFSGQSQRALRAFPGGAASGPSGGALSTGGFASVTISDGSGRKGTQFSKMVDVGMRVSEGTVDPATGDPIEDGDAIGVFSYDPASGAWVSEGEATVSGPPENGTFAVNFQSDHLTYFSAGYEQEACTSGATIQVDRNGNEGTLSVTVEGTDGGFSDEYTLASGTSQFTLSGVASASAEVTVTGSGGSASVTVQDACSGSGSLTLPAPAGPTIEVDFTLVPTCSSPDQAVRVQSVPSAVVFHRLASRSEGPWTKAGTVQWTFNQEESYLEKGELSVAGLIDGETYSFKTTYDGETYQKSVTISGSSKTINEDVDADYCD